MFFFIFVLCVIDGKRAYGSSGDQWWNSINTGMKFKRKINSK